MGTATDLARYIVLGHPWLERAAHRLEQFARARAQRREIRAGGAARTVHLDGSVLPLDLSNLREYLTYRASVTLGGYFHEPGTTEQILGALSGDSVFVDVGANIGYFTLLALSRLKAPGAIYSLEPNPETYRRLVRNVRLNDPLGVVRTLDVAAADAEGTATLFHSPVEDARDSLTQVGRTGIDVRTCRLDSLGLNGRNLVLKIDAEGSEERVLRGMTGMIRDAPSLAIALEWNPPMAGRSLWEALRGQFRIRRIEERRPVRLVEVEALSDIRYRLTNLWLERR